MGLDRDCPRPQSSLSNMATSIGTEPERLLINQHWNYGARVHEEVADVLLARLSEGTDLVHGHAVFTRLYQEQIAALEDFGAFAWALRERHDEGFLSAYLRYQIRDVRAFWTIVRDHDDDLVTLLRLPSRDEIENLLARLPKTEDSLSDILAMRMANLRQGADQFFAENEIVISVYNKLKHGIPIIREDENDYRVFHVLLFRGGVASARFEITSQMIRRLHRNTQAWSNALRDLAGLTKILFDGELLYRSV